MKLSTRCVNPSSDSLGKPLGKMSDRCTGVRGDYEVAIVLTGGGVKLQLAHSFQKSHFAQASVPCELD